MLCETITEGDLNNLDDNWKANLKYDGERIAVIKLGFDIFVVNRVGRIKNQIYPEIVEAISKINGDFILDGEVITTDGIFNTLQHRNNLSTPAKIENARTQYPINYMVFDVLYYGEDLRNKPLRTRLDYLFNFKLNIPITSIIKFAEYTDIQTALSFAKSNRKEGIVVKNMLSTYEGRRSKSWLKLKLFKEEPFRAISYTTNPAGIRVEDNNLNACQVAGYESNQVKGEIDKKGYCDIVIQYLEKTKDDRYRFISFKEVVK